MSVSHYLSKTKADLVDIVRISKVMPISQAQRMRKAELAAFLAQKEKEVELTKEPPKPARRENEPPVHNTKGRARRIRPSVMIPDPSLFEDSTVEIVEQDVAEAPAKSESRSVLSDRGWQNRRRSRQTPTLESESTTEPTRSPQSRTRRSRKVLDDREVKAPEAQLETAEPSAEEVTPIEHLVSTKETAETQEPKLEVSVRDHRKKTSQTRGQRSQQKVVRRISPEPEEVTQEIADAAPQAARASDPDSDVRDQEARPRPAGRSRTQRVNRKDRQERHDRQDRPEHQDRQEAQAKHQEPVVEIEETHETSESIEDPREAKRGKNKVRKEDRVLESRPQTVVTGVLELMPDGYGFLRLENYIQNPHDAYVPPQLVRRFGLRNGDLLSGLVRDQRDQDRYRAMTYINEVNGMNPEKMQGRPHFDRLTPIYPLERFSLETVKNEFSTRVIDLFAPIGKGQRGMIVSPPKAGKTILLQKIANSVATNNPNAKLIVLLIDERPEEVTDMQRMIKGEVVYSTFDKTPDNHVRITELVLDRAKRMVELGEDVVILLDSMTRMARAYNSTINPTGRTLSGGLDPGALYGPKKFFGAARNIENGGSLTIVATSLVETGSRMDEVIFEEFKGTGNMEVVLDRKLSERRIFPAIDVNRSGTRREELLLTRKELESVWGIRKAFGHMDSVNVTEMVLNLLQKTRDNEHFVSSISQTLSEKMNLAEMGKGSNLR